MKFVLLLLFSQDTVCSVSMGSAVNTTKNSVNPNTGGYLKNDIVVVLGGVQDVQAANRKGELLIMQQS
jgi:hypothetical protein